MRKFEIHTTGIAREVYVVEAPDEATARKMYENGEVTEPISLEVESSEIEEINRVPE